MRYLAIAAWREFVDFHPLSEGLVDGFVFGDSFCPEHMFPRGNADMVHAAVLLAEAGGRLLYQTPFYATDKVCREVVSMVGFLEDLGVLDGVIVQDIGLLALIREAVPTASLIWGRLGKARAESIGRDSLLFLRELGVCAVENENLCRSGLLRKLDFAIYNAVGVARYVTFSRVCYSCHFSGLSSFECNRRCLFVSEKLFADSANYDVCGHVIDCSPARSFNLKSFQDAAAVCNHVIVYAHSLEEFRQILNDYVCSTS